MNDDVDVGRITVIGICSVIAVYVFIVLTRVAFMQLEDEQTKIKVIDSKPRSLAKYQEEQAARLGGNYRWADEKTRAVHLPIDVAMAKVTQELAASHKLGSVRESDNELSASPKAEEPAAETPKKAKARAVPRP